MIMATPPDMHTLEIPGVGVAIYYGEAMTQDEKAKALAYIKEAYRRQAGDCHHGLASHVETLAKALQEVAKACPVPVAYDEEETDELLALLEKIHRDYQREQARGLKSRQPTGSYISRPATPPLVTCGRYPSGFR